PEGCRSQKISALYRTSINRPKLLLKFLLFLTQRQRKHYRMRAELIGLCLLLAVSAAFACAPADCLSDEVDDDCLSYCAELGEEAGLANDKRASFVRLGKRASFVRLGKKKRASFVRLGKKKRASFVRLGKRASFVRLGKRASFVRLGKKKRASFVRLGKRASFVRLGKRPSYEPEDESYLDDEQLNDAKKRASFVRLG
ncbi:hypothetical protein BOX15_Mlig028341g1, partial [Macrostomum lignano]